MTYTQPKTTWSKVHSTDWVYSHEINPAMTLPDPTPTAAPVFAPLFDKLSHLRSPIGV